MKSALPFFALATAPLICATAGRFQERHADVRQALSALESSLQTRFHQVDNVNFGFDRVANGAGHQRMHGGPSMDRMMDLKQLIAYTKTHTRPTKNGTHRYLADDGKWHEAKDLAQKFRPEDSAETSAVSVLKHRKVSVAIYTSGPIPPGSDARLRGPAFLSDVAYEAPARSTLLAAAQKEWRISRRTEMNGAEGWRIIAEPVIADDTRCVNCHSTFFKSTGYKFRLGKPLGMLMIAYRWASFPH